MDENTHETPEEFEPTIRMERPADTGTTKIRKAAPPTGGATDEKPFAKEEKSSVGVLIEHLTGIFRRRNDADPDADRKPGDRSRVLLDITDASEFPPLEEAYKRGEEIGSGGQARLYRGFDLHLRRQAAVKSLREEQGKHPELREKFVSEAMITAQLDHPAIVPVYSIHRDKNDNLHLAMKLVNGRPFQKYLSELVRHYDQDGFSPQEEQRSLNYRLEVFLTICDALEYAHNRNIMHGDLKPENIMIGEYHEAYLMDWGLAKRIEDPDFDPATWKAPTVITGTPRFLSPEAVCGERCDQRADIYAMGLILYEVVTLQYGYPGSDHHETINRIRRGEMRPVTHRYKYPIPVDLRKIILKAAAWEKDKRYQSMAEFSSDLRRFIRGEEVTANPDSFFGRFARWGYRHRRLMLGLVLTFVALGAVAVAYSIYERYNQEQIRHHQEQILARTLGYAMGASRSLDRQITKMEYGLYSATTEALLLLNAELTAHGDTPVYYLRDLHDPRKKPETLKFSPGFGFTVDLDHPACHVAPGSNPQKVEDRMRRLTLLTPMLMRSIVESGSRAVLSEGNLSTLREEAFREGVPLVSIYFGFNDGLFVTYPGELGIDPYDYDHRKRPWYVRRFDGTHRSAALIWGNPYLSVNNKLVLTCTLPMIDTHGRHHGIAAADVSLPRMVDELRGEGNQGKALLAKSLVDRDGNIVLDLGENFIRDSAKNYKEENGKLKLMRYPDRKLFEQIRERRVGYVVRTEKGKRVAYVFSGMFSVPWYYIEKLDVAQLLADAGPVGPARRWRSKRSARGAGLE